MAKKSRRRTTRKSSSAFSLPKELTSVTPTSRMVAYVVLIGLVALAFVWGMKFRESNPVIDPVTNYPRVSAYPAK